jgi:hypothetical protein
MSNSLQMGGLAQPVSPDEVEMREQEEEEKHEVFTISES